MKKVFFDLDGTLAEWRNEAKREDLLEKGYFISLKPMTEMVDAAKRLMENGFETYVISKYWTCGDYALPEKKEWCAKYLPFIPADHLLFVPDEMEKAEIVKEITGVEVSRDDVLIDDYTKNLIEWTQSGGIGIKCINGWNDKTGKFIGPRVKTADDVLEVLCRSK